MIELEFARLEHLGRFFDLLGFDAQFEGFEEGGGVGDFADFLFDLFGDLLFGFFLLFLSLLFGFFALLSLGGVGFAFLFADGLGRLGQFIRCRRRLGEGFFDATNHQVADLGIGLGTLGGFHIKRFVADLPVAEEVRQLHHRGRTG